MSANGHQARDVMLGLMKTCSNFFAYLGDRLGINGTDGPIQPLSWLVKGTLA